MTYTTFEEDSFEPTMPVTGVQSEELVEPQTDVTLEDPTVGEEPAEPAQAEVVPEEEPMGFLDFGHPGSGAGFLHGSGDPDASLSEELSGLADNVTQMATAGPVGMYDWIQDFTNWAAPELGQNLPTIPPYQHQGAQLWRQLWSFIGPMNITGSILKNLGTRGQLLTGQIAGSSLRGITPKAADLLNKLGRDKLFALFARTGIPIGSGVFVDSINDLNAEGENLGSLVRNRLDENWKWVIPEQWAVLPTDGPDDIRRKQVLEGVYLAGLGELLPIFTAFLKNKRNLNDTLEMLAKDAKAVDYQQKIDDAYRREIVDNETIADLDAALEGPGLEDAVDVATAKYVRSGIRRSEQMDEVSRLSDDLNPNMDEPMMLRDSDQFDAAEESIITVGPDATRGAMRDNAEILNNSNTIHGRVRNLVSEAGRMFGLKAEELTRRTLVSMVKNEMVDAGKFDVKRNINGNETYLTYKDIDAAGTDLAEYLMDSTADKGFIQGLLTEFTEVKNGLINLNDVGMNAVSKAIDYWKDEYFNLDQMKASALLQTSFAGQIADIAEGARRFPEDAVIKHARDEILDRLEFLMTEQAIGKHLRGQALNFLNRWKRVWKKVRKSPEGYREYLKKEAEELGVAAAINAKNSVAETKRFIHDIRTLSAEHPEFLKSFLQVNELTDGNVHTIMGYVDFWKNNYGTFSKLFVDQNPNTPSMIVQGIMGNFFNSMLSAPKTANKAGLSNAAMILHKPLSVISGSIMRKDWEGLRRGWYAFNAFGETTRMAAGHAAMVLRKLNTDPRTVPYATRENIAIRNAQNREAAESFAQAMEQSGNHGGRFFANMVEGLDQLQMNRFARAIVNGMGMYDGFTRAFVANGVARFRAYDEAVQMGDFRPEIMQKARVKHLEAMKKDGYFMDPDVDFQTREMAMNLDHPVTEAVDDLIRQVPALRLFMTFPKIYMNIVGTAWNNSFLSAFAGDMREIIGFPGTKKVHSEEEIRAIFAKRGKAIPTAPGELTRQFDDMKNEILGRVGFTSLVMGSIFSYVWSDGCRGDGHRDPAVQRSRGKNWVPRTCKNPIDGKWYSYEALGPQYAEWIAFIANVSESFDELGVAKTEELLQKAQFVLAASLTQNNFAVGLEPLLRFFGGDPQDMAQFSAQTTNALAPVSGLRSDFGKLLSDGVKELNNTYEESMMNRNRWTQIFGTSLPEQRSHIDGKVVGGSDSMFHRLYNFLSPMPAHDDVSPEQQFLIDIQYDSLPSLLRSTNGVEYTTDERAEIRTIMGEMGLFQKAINIAMRKAKDSDWLNKLRRARMPFAPDYEGGMVPLGYYSEDLDKREFTDLYDFLDRELENAKKQAELQMQERARILIEGKQQEQNQDRTRFGKMPILRNK